MNRRLRAISARSSARPNSPKSTIRSGGVSRARRACARRSGAAASRSDGPELMTIRRRVDAFGKCSQQLGECRLRPSPKRVAGTDMRDDQLVRRLRCRSSPGAPATRRSAAGSGDISTASRDGSVLAARPAVDRLQQVPLVDDRMPWRAARAGGSTVRVYIQLRPWTSYPIRCRAPLASVSQLLRGPP